MSTRIRTTNRALLALAGLLLLALAAAAALAAAGRDPGLSAAGRLVTDLAGSTPDRRLAAGAAALAALLALVWLASQRGGRADVAARRAGEGPVLGDVVVTADAVEALLHRGLRRHPDAVAAGVAAVRRRGDPEFRATVVPRRGADPGDLARHAQQVRDDAALALGTGVTLVTHLRAGRVRQAVRDRSRRVS